jgi:hypothetical protein
MNLGWRDTSHFYARWPGAVICLAVGAALAGGTAASLWSADTCPLLTATGRVAAVESLKGGVYFELVEPSRAFVHISKAGQLGLVADALRDAGSEPVTVSYHPDDVQSPLQGGSYRVMRALSVGGRPVLTVEQVAGGVARDDVLGLCVGLAALACGLARATWLWRRRHLL